MVKKPSHTIVPLMLLMLANPCKWHRAVRRVPFGAQKSRTGPYQSEVYRYGSFMDMSFCVPTGDFNEFQGLVQ